MIRYALRNCMATIRVQPLPDDVDMRQNWQVTKNGRRKSRHLKKSAAKRKARQIKNPNDSIVLHRTDGTVMPK